MTQGQYDDLCKILKKKLTEKELKEMGFGKVDGKFDEVIDYDITLFKIEDRRRNDWRRRNDKS